MPTLLYHPAGWRSAKKLAAALNIKRTKHSKPPTSPVDVLIRWGSAAKVPNVATEINPRASLVGYKGRNGQMEAFTKADVPCPNFTTSPTAAAAFGDVMYHGSTNGKPKMSGRGLKKVKGSAAKSLDPKLFVQFIPKHRQFRVHVFDGLATRTREIIHVSELSGQPGSMAFKRNEGVRTQDIWNYGNGFRYMVVQGQRPNGVIPAAKAAVAALKLDFGAVDIITTKEGEVYVLEVNTAPGLGPLTLEWYTEHLTHRIAQLQETL